MSKKRTTKRTTTRRRTKKQVSWGRKLFGFLFKLSLIGVVLGGIGMIYLDAQIRQQFEGKRWALPAKSMHGHWICIRVCR